ncbi:MAG: hypothetical protein EBR01_10925 [Proteobacteria bacterium]|nr:hypothetical protein [Pseudomonadota bacterium]
MDFGGRPQKGWRRRGRGTLPHSPGGGRKRNYLGLRGEKGVCRQKSRPEAGRGTRSGCPIRGGKGGHDFGGRLPSIA